jgi:hypothetical protein
VSFLTSAETDLTWLRGHLLALVVVGALIFGGVYGVESLVARHDATTESKWTTILKNQTDQNTLLQTQITADEARSAAIQTQLLAMNAQLSAARNTRDTQTAVAVKQVPTLSAEQTAQSLTQQTGANVGEITASSDTVILDLPIAHVLLSDALLVPTVQADNKDLATELANETTIANNAVADVAAQKKLVLGLEDQITTTAKVSAAEIKTLKAQARRSKLRWFLSGVIVGFIGRTLTHP